MVFSLSNTVDLIADSISLIEDNKVVDVKELFLSKLDSIDTIVGLAPETLNTLAKLGEAINNDSQFYQTLITDLSFKANTADTYRKDETYTEDEVNGLFEETSSNLTQALALKANTADTYTRSTIDGNIAALRDETTTKLGLVYTMEQTMSSYDLGENFTQTIADYNSKIAVLRDETTTKLGLVYTKEQTMDNYELGENFTQTIADYNAKIALKSDIETVYTKTQINNLLNSTEPEFIAVSPILKILNSQTGNMELKLSSALTDLLDTKTDEEQVRSLVNAYEPYTFEAPLELNEIRATGERRIIMGASYSQNLLAKASVVSLTTLTDNINSRLAGILTPNKIEITSNSWPQVQINSTSDTTDPSEIAFNRQSKSQYLKSAMGVSGDLTRGAFWWAGGQDRININCETGVVKVRSGFEVQAMNTDIIKGLSSTTVRIEDNAIITGNVNINGYAIVQGSFLVAGATTINSNTSINGNLTTTGTITASNSNPFWIAGKVNGATFDKLSSKGRYVFNVWRVPGNAAGVYEISFAPAHPDGDNYVICLTCGSNHHYTREGFGSDSKFQIVLTNAANSALDTMF